MKKKQIEELLIFYFIEHKYIDTHHYTVIKEEKNLRTFYYLFYWTILIEMFVQTRITANSLNITYSTTQINT